MRVCDRDRVALPLQPRHRRRPQDLGERRQREQDPPKKRRAGGEREHASIDRGRGNAAQALGPRRHEHGQRPARHRDTGDGAQGGQDQALDEALPEEARPPGAQRDPQRDLRTARRRPRGEQPRDIDAGDQQQDPDAPEEREERRPDLPHAVRLEPDRVVAAPGAPVLGELPRDSRRDCVDLEPRLLERHIGLHSAHDAQKLLAARALGHLGPERHPRLEVVGHRGVRGQQQLERGGHHPDDRRRLPVEEDAPPDDGRIAAVPPLPQGIAQEDARGRVPPLVVARERAAEGSFGAQHREEIRRHESDPQLLRLAFARQRRAVRPDRAEAGEELRPLPQIRELRTRQGRARVAGLGHVGPHERQPGGFAVRKRRQQHRVDHAEDRGAGADPEAQCQHRREREAGRLPEAAPRIADVAQRRLDPDPDPGVPRRFLDRIHAAHLDPGRAPRRRRIQPFSDFFLRQALEIAPDLLVEVGVQARAAQQRPKEAHNPGGKRHAFCLRDFGRAGASPAPTDPG